MPPRTEPASAEPAPSGPTSAGPDHRTGDADDAYWRRPSPGTSAQTRPAAATSGEPPRYEGPPRSVPPPPAWRPPVVVPTMQPRTMPEQDHDRLDAEERAARTNSHGIGLVAAAVIVILVFVLCARVVG